MGRKRRQIFANKRDRTKRKTNRPINLNEIARSAMRKYGFNTDFPAIALKKTQRMDERVIENQMGKVEDLTHLLWSSIDNIDTEDLDQIEYCERSKSGAIHIKVAIADVDSYVPKDSILDKHAQRNTTSVYTGVEIFPMFPDKLSKDLTSLPMNKNRLAMITEYEVLPRGNVKPGRIYRALVRNKAKLVYEQVGEWLEGRGPIPKMIEKNNELEKQIRLQHEASERLGKFRVSQGALNIETLQTRAVVKGGKVLDLHVLEEDAAKRIIENFMIGANGVISKKLEKSGKPTIQRVVRRPKYWKEIVELAKKHKFKLPKNPDALALAKFLDRQKLKNPEQFSDLSLTVVKLLGSGEYVLYDKKKPIGHFCMAVSSYTHSTAPNRRYPDLIIQRLIKAELDGQKSPYTKEELRGLAMRCTTNEHAAKKVERFVTKAEGATLLSGKVGNVFDAIVTGASRKGNYARIIEPPIEGKIVGPAKRIKVGQKIKVKLVNLDPWKGYIDFVLA
jgi:ribonuclease R